MKRIFYFLVLILFFSCCSVKQASKEEACGPEMDSVQTIELVENVPIEEELQYEEEMMTTPPPTNLPKSKSKKPNQKQVEETITPINDEPILGETIMGKSGYLENQNPEIGDINYVIQDSMIVGKTEQIVVTLSNGLDRDEVISKIEYLAENEENVVTNEIRLAPIMSVKLIDPTGENFKIIPITSEQQFLENKEITFWKWNITPLKKGNNPLTLTIDIIVNNNTKNIQVYEDFIYVYSTETVWDKVTDFWKSDWKWIFSTLLIPLFLWLYRLLKKKNLA